MTIRVKLFASQAERAGVKDVALEVGQGATVMEVVEILRGKFPEMGWPGKTMVAVNLEYVAMDAVLREGDEVALIPPVSGGCE